MSRKTLLQLICTAVLLSVSCFAVDGVVLINQNTVLAAGGFPYTITQPGSYKLTSNLVVPVRTDGIDINVSGVSLDLNGFSIVTAGTGTCDGDATHATTQCSGTFSNVGVRSAGGTIGISVRNGSVSGMGSAILLGGTGSLVEEVRAFHNIFDGIFIASGIIRRCSAENNGEEGLETGSQLGGSLIIDSVANANFDSGIVVEGGAIQNTAGFNGKFGLVVQQGIAGSNSLDSNNIGQIFIVFRGVSQNNNECDGTLC